jgi:hypothetical protein
LKAIRSLESFRHQKIVLGKPTREFSLVYILVEVAKQDDLVARLLPVLQLFG